MTVRKAFSKLKATLTAGPDLIPSFLVKDCATILSKPLTAIFNMIFTSCKFPEVWKESRVTPVFKCGDRSDFSNYRPITIINNFAKIFEQVVHSFICPHISGILSTCQHGFVKGRSTITNLAVKTQYLHM